MMNANLEKLNVKDRHASADGQPLPALKATVLVIDDEEAIGACLQAFLERMGYRVLRAGSGSEALAIAQGAGVSIDLALLDVVLPDMTGQALYPGLLDAQPNLKVIVCSGYGADGPVAEILAGGADDYLQKPFSLTSLHPKLEALLPASQAPLT